MTGDEYSALRRVEAKLDRVIEMTLPRLAVLEERTECLPAMRADVQALKAKAGLWGLFAGALVSALAALAGWVRGS